MDDLKKVLKFPSNRFNFYCFVSSVSRRCFRLPRGKKEESEHRCEELVTQIHVSTMPLLGQIEAMQETTARREEAWAGVERSLNSRLQEAEAKESADVENERLLGISDLMS
ncbi:golgin candidate 5-like [Papaver somniferum]|uniref:golgin candidate 5-like n=1 Tax=Papaver somniferum TaxID=3469 RepID=UPI000E6FFA7A|nr:golgin candidate 5-like [Papaver somniferum]